MLDRVLILLKIILIKVNLKYERKNIEKLLYDYFFPKFS